MNKELYVSSTPHETRLALAEDGEIAELYYEREKEYSLAGAIYKGRVTRVLPGMQSAFVDLGLERDAFLYVSDFFEDSEEYDRVVSEAENAVAAAGALTAAATAVEPAAAPAEAGAELRREPRTEAPRAESVRPEARTESRDERGAHPDDRGPREGNRDDADGDRRRRGGRHRRGRRSGGFPDAKFARPEPGGGGGEPRGGDNDHASEERPAGHESSREGGRALTRPPLREVLPPVEPAAPARPAVAVNAPVEHPVDRPAERPAPGAYAPMILPGESLAKYRGREAAPAPVRAPAVVAAVNEPAPEASAPEPTVAATAAEETDVPESRESYEHDRMQPDSPRHEAVAAPAEPEAAPTLEAEADAAMEAIEAALDRAETEAENGEAEGDGGQGDDDEFLVEITENDQFDEDGNLIPPVAAESRPAGENGSARVESRPGGGPARLQARAERGGGGRGRGRRRGRGGRGGYPEGPREGQRGRGAAPAAGASPATAASAPAPRSPDGPRLIGDLLREGQEILIQISKEPLGKKGARITSHLALPGRFLVYMPTVHHIGVSRKIGSDEERARLKRFILEQTADLPGGFIVRTAAAGATDEELAADVRLLANLWTEIRQQFETKRSPALLHHDLDLVERVLRDQLSTDFTHIWVDTDEMYQRVVRFVGYFMPQLASRVRLYTREVPLFEHFGIEEEINKALRSKVWLKSGGYIVLNQTEALVAIDVNTGKYVGKSNRLEDTIVKTNVDAIKEIVRQIRLRDLGGIIVIDFIDMDERRNRMKVMAALDEAMRADRAPSKVLSFNDFGLVALTRKRVKQSLERTLGGACPYCDGVGLVKSPTTVCNEIHIEARKVAPTIEREDLVLRVHPEIAKALKAHNASRLRELEELTGKAISVRPDPQVHQEQYEFY